ncbi:MAG TPA: hypothetical protein VHG71_12265 [Verrucomicrobiae bacterium]|nr:hypothetical protein [Verrucomicrobiae bacterium]
MTSEQTIISVIIVGICAFLGAYFRKKGENFATKEDIARITRTQEEIKTELANRSHFSRVRYEREMEIYREVWKAIYQFYLESLAAFGWGKNLTDGVKKLSRESWQQSHSQLSNIIDQNKPFYSDEVRVELSEFSTLAFWLATELKQDVLKHEDIQKRSEIAMKVKGQYEKVESAIRKRLEQFDKVN